MDSVRTKENTFTVFKGVDSCVGTPFGTVLGLFEQHDPYIAPHEYVVISRLLGNDHSWKIDEVEKGTRIITTYKTTPYCEFQNPCGKTEDGVPWYFLRIPVPFEYDDQENKPIPVFTKLDDNYRKILGVFAKIILGEQYVGFKIEGLENDVYLSPEQLKLSTGVCIAEVEILINSKIRVAFYQIDEVMKDGRVCDISNSKVKDFSIIPSGSVQEMRQNYKHLIPRLKQISKIYLFIRNDIKKVGFEIHGMNSVFLPVTKLTYITLLKPNEFQILVGSYVDPVFYKEGELLYDNTTCQANNVLVKELNLRYRDTKKNMREEFKNMRHNPYGILANKLSITDNVNNFKEPLMKSIELAYNEIKSDKYKYINYYPELIYEFKDLTSLALMLTKIAIDKITNEEKLYEIRALIYIEITNKVKPLFELEYAIKRSENRLMIPVNIVNRIEFYYNEQIKIKEKENLNMVITEINNLIKLNSLNTRYYYWIIGIKKRLLPYCNSIEERGRLNVEIEKDYNKIKEIDPNEYEYYANIDKRIEEHRQEVEYEAQEDFMNELGNNPCWDDDRDPDQQDPEAYDWSP